MTFLSFITHSNFISKAEGTALPKRQKETIGFINFNKLEAAQTKTFQRLKLPSRQTRRIVSFKISETKRFVTFEDNGFCVTN